MDVLPSLHKYWGICPPCPIGIDAPAFVDFQQWRRQAVKSARSYMSARQVSLKWSAPACTATAIHGKLGSEFET